MDRERETERAPAERMQAGGGGRTKGLKRVQRVTSPGRASAVEKRVRAAHYARDASRSSVRGSKREIGSETRGRTERDENHTVVVTTGGWAVRGERDR